MSEENNNRPLSNEVKRHFLEIVSTYNKYQEMIERKSDMIEVCENLGGIIEAARELALRESDDWFDKHTIKRNMSELDKLGKQFDKLAIEARKQDQRLISLYEDMGNILSRYYKFGDISEEEMKKRLAIQESVKEKLSENISQKTIKHPTQKGMLHLEIEEDAAGVMVDVIFNKVDLTTTDIQFPSGDVKVTQRKKRVNLKESVNEAISKLKKPLELGQGKKGVYYLHKVGHDTNGNWSYIVSRGSNKPKKIQHQGQWREKLTKNHSDEDVFNSDTAEEIIKYYEKYVNESINEDAKTVYKKGKGLFVDTDFVNASKGKLPNSELKHAGYGDFFLDTPDGKVYFIRTGEKFDGMKGRAHRITDNEQNGKLVAQLIKKMGARIQESVNESGGYDITLKHHTKGKFAGYVVATFSSDRAKNFAEKAFKTKSYDSWGRPMIAFPERGLDRFKAAVKKGKFAIDNVRLESVNEATTSQVNTAINRIKKSLTTKWKKKGGYENFGDAEVRKLKDKFNYNPYGDSEERKIAAMIDSFDNWAMNYVGESVNESEGNKESKEAEKINKSVKGEEIPFYDALEKMHDKMKHANYMKWLSSALKGYGKDMFRDPKIKNKAEAEEALYKLSK